jgi:choline-sulfatase
VRGFANLSVGLAVLALCGCAERTPPGGGQGPAGAPDVLLITLDTFRADRAGCMGYPGGLTPALDRLLRNGRLARDAYAPAPLTAVSHASILTGLDPPRHGVRDNGSFVLADSLPTLATVFTRAGFRTGGFVSGFPVAAQFGFGRDFATFDDQFDQPGVERLYFAQRAADKVVDSLLSWLSGLPPTARWFAWAHFLEPHYPRQVRPPLRGLPAAGDYEREIRGLDLELRRLERGLELLGGGRMPVVAMVTDHGEGLGDHLELSHGILLYEETMRGLFGISAPRASAEAERLGTGFFEGVVRYADLAPTLLDVLGLESAPPGSGRSRLREESAAEGAYGETYGSLFRHGWSPLLSWRDERWAYIESPHPELYDRQADPGETRNVLGDHPEVAEEIVKRLEKLAREPELPGSEALDEDSRRKLEALGYIATGGTTRADRRKDPKLYIGAVNLLFRGTSLLAENKPAAALPVLQQSYLLDPENPSTVFQLADCLRNLGDKPTAMTYYRRALELNPQLGEAWAHLAILEFERGRREEAFHLLEDGLAHGPSSFPLLMTTADLYFEAGKYADAEAFYRRASEQNPRLPEVWLQLARLAEMRGAKGEAEEARRRARELGG